MVIEFVTRCPASVSGVVARLTNTGSETDEIPVEIRLPTSIRIPFQVVHHRRFRHPQLLHDHCVTVALNFQFLGSNSLFFGRHLFNRP